jgi:hypothetical protein
MFLSFNTEENEQSIIFFYKLFDYVLTLFELNYVITNVTNLGYKK